MEVDLEGETSSAEREENFRRRRAGSCGGAGDVTGLATVVGATTTTRGVRPERLSPVTELGGEGGRENECFAHYCYREHSALGGAYPLGPGVWGG